MTTNGQPTDNAIEQRAPELSVPSPPLSKEGDNGQRPGQQPLPDLVGRGEGRINGDLIEHVGFTDHMKPDGHVVRLTTWRRRCRSCREEFEMAFSVGARVAVDLGRLFVRCPACRSVKKFQPGEST